MTFILRLFFLIVFILISHIFYAKEYSISSLDVQIELLSDGKMKVTETREFTFDGEFSRVFRNFPISDEVTFSDFKVTESGMEYVLSNSEAPGTYNIVRDEDETEVLLFFDAKDTVRTFTITFIADGVLKKYEDAVLLYYQIISDDWNKATNNIKASVYPPEELPSGEPQHWVQGSLNAYSEIKRDGVVEVFLERLPKNRFLEIRALYPVNSFHEMPLNSGTIAEQTREEMKILVEEANRKREQQRLKKQKTEQRHELGRQLAIPVSLLILGIWIFFYRKYTKNKPVIENKEMVFNQLPEKDLPALVSYLTMYTQVSGNALVATLFHLAYRGYLTVKEEEIPSKSPRKKPKTDVILYLNNDYRDKHQEELTRYERSLINFLFSDIGKIPNQVSLKEISKKSNKMQSFFGKWGKEVKEVAKSRNWYDDDSRKKRNKTIIISVVIMALCVAGTILYGPWMLIPVGMSFAFMIGSLFIYHRTEKGEITFRRWMKMKKQLRKQKFSDQEDNFDATKINEYLIYGIALGLGERFYRDIFKSLEQSGNEAFLWWVAIYPGSIDSFSKTVGDVITTTSTTVSSVSGAGGAGVAGGGGGAASGGGGAS